MLVKKNANILVFFFKDLVYFKSVFTFAKIKFQIKFKIFHLISDIFV